MVMENGGLFNDYVKLLVFNFISPVDFISTLLYAITKDKYNLWDNLLSGFDFYIPSKGNYKIKCLFLAFIDSFHIRIVKKVLNFEKRKIFYKWMKIEMASESIFGFI